MSGAVIPTSILFSSLRTAYNNGGLDDAADDSGLSASLPAPVSLSDFRTAVMADAPPVPSGSATISIGTVFRGKTFGANDSFSLIANSPFSGTTAPSDITGVVNDEFIFIYSKDSSDESNDDKATITFTNSNSPSARIYSVINIGGSNSIEWPVGGTGILTHVPYNTTTASPTYAWNRTSSAAEGIHNSVWDSTCGLGGADGDHNSYSYIKVRIGPAGGAAASGTNTIAMTISSESDYDKLFVYKNAAGGGGGGGSSSNATYWLYLHDTGGNGSADSEFALATYESTDNLTPTDLSNFGGNLGITAEKAAKLTGSIEGYNPGDPGTDLPAFSYTLPIPDSGTTVYDLYPYDAGDGAGGAYEFRWGIAKSGGSMLTFAVDGTTKGGPAISDLFLGNDADADFWNPNSAEMGVVIQLTLDTSGDGTISVRDA
jgi:hypothetical protein